MGTAPETVACDGCTACCRGEAVFLQPGDNPLLYRTVTARDPISGQPGQRIPLNPDGSCTYLGEGGCTIYDRRPLVCRAFSCVGFVRKALSRAAGRERKELRRTGGQWAGDIWDAGMKRMG